MLVLIWWTWDMIDATVDDHRPLLQPVSSHHLCSARPHHQDVGPAYLKNDSFTL